MKNKLMLLLFLILFIPLINVNAEKQINIHLFTKIGCRHCEAEKEFLDDYLLENNDLKLYIYEVSESEESRTKFYDIQELLNKRSSGVPVMVIGNQMLVGFDKASTTGENIKKIVNYYRTNPYRDLAGEKFGIVPVNEDITLENIDILKEKINIPFIGEIDPQKYPLFILAVIIGFIDGFNPCAMWILLFLITMLFGMKDRTKMWILGLTFLGVSSLTYLLFMISWLNIATMLSQINIIRLIISFVALVFGGYNIYSYIKKRKEDDGCEVVDSSQRKNIMIRIEEIVNDPNFLAALIGIAVLAVLVNFIELLCSLGLPVIYTQVLAMNDLNGAKYLGYILVYIFFFLLDDLIIFIIAMKTFKITAVSNKYTKYSHLIGGIIMLLIGLLMMFKPEWLMFNFK